MKYKVESFLTVIFLVLTAVFWRNPPTDSGGWASWVQAFGAIAAIGLAIWLQNQATREKADSAKRLSQAFAFRLNRVLIIMQADCLKENVDQFFLSRANLKEILKLGRSIPLADLSSEYQNLVIELRSDAFEVFERTSSDDLRMFPSFKNLLTHYQAKVDKQCVMLGLRPIQEAIDLVAAR